MEKSSAGALRGLRSIPFKVPFSKNLDVRKVSLTLKNLSQHSRHAGVVPRVAFQRGRNRFLHNYAFLSRGVSSLYTPRLRGGGCGRFKNPQPRFSWLFFGSCMCAPRAIWGLNMHLGPVELYPGRKVLEFRRCGVGPSIWTRFRSMDHDF